MSQQLDPIDTIATKAFEGYVVRKDLVRRFKGQYPVPTYVAEFLLGRYCASVDEDEIAADVETSHAIEAIKSIAEHELRELATYTSALAGDPDVSRDHNLFRAETFARGMWDAVQLLPLGKGYQARLMRFASNPMAQVLRKVYAGACARLESAGVVPALHRTLILPAGARTSRPSESWIGGSPTLHQLRATIPLQQTHDARDARRDEADDCREIK